MLYINPSTLDTCDVPMNADIPEGFICAEDIDIVKWIEIAQKQRGKLIITESSENVRFGYRYPELGGVILSAENAEDPNRAQYAFSLAKKKQPDSDGFLITAIKREV